MFAPAVWLIDQVRTGEFGPVPLGGLTYWSGLWATALLLLALAITPAVTILRFGRLVIVRRMIGVTALVYTIAHIVIYFALRLWDFTRIGRDTPCQFQPGAGSARGLEGSGDRAHDRARGSATASA